MAKGQFSIQWHITNKCNLRCIHCYQEDYTNEGDIQKLKEYYSNIESFLIKENLEASIAVTGGEPFAFKSIRNFIDFLSNQDRVKEIILLSNGTLITEEIASYLSSKVSRVQISLDGGTQEIHEKVRGEDSFNAALTGIRNLKKYNIAVQVQMVAHKGNKDSIDDLVNVCNENNVDRLLITRLVPEGAASSGLEDLLLTKDEYKELLYKLNEYSFDSKNKVKVLKGRQLWRLIDSNKGSACPIGFSSITLMPNGTVYPCRRLPIDIGNLNEKSFYNIWLGSKVLWDLRNKELLKGNCGRCEDKEKCSGCRAVAHGFYNDYLAEDPYCWKCNE